MAVETFFLAMIISLIIVIVMMLFRVFKGPSIYDRLNGLGVIGVDAILLLVLIGFYNKREAMFVDISLAYAILGFISMVVLAKYIGEKGDTDA